MFCLRILHILSLSQNYSSLSDELQLQLNNYEAKKNRPTSNLIASTGSRSACTIMNVIEIRIEHNKLK